MIPRCAIAIERAPDSPNGFRSRSRLRGSHEPSRRRKRRNERYLCSRMSMNVEQTLRDLGWALPAPPKPIAAYVPSVRSGNLLFVSGQLPTRDGKLLATGAVPTEVAIEKAQEAAGQCAVNALAILGGDLGGDWNRLVRVVRVGAFVLSSSGFADQAK